MAPMVSDWMGRMGASFVKGIKLSIPVDLFAWCFFRGFPSLMGPKMGMAWGFPYGATPKNLGFSMNHPALGDGLEPPRPARTMAA